MISIYFLISVPNYEVIHLHTIHKREISAFNTTDNTDDRSKRSIAAEKVLKLKAFGKKHELALQPLDQQLFKGNLKMWSAESDGNGSISYTELPDVSKHCIVRSSSDEGL